jgi:hypothetical protein
VKLQHLEALNIAGTPWGDSLGFLFKTIPPLRALRLSLSGDVKQLEEQWRAFEEDPQTLDLIKVRFSLPSLPRAWTSGSHRSGAT